MDSRDHSLSHMDKKRYKSDAKQKQKGDYARTLLGKI